VTAPVVLVSGAGGGIGAATVRRFAAGGWRIVAVDLDSQALDRLDSAPVIARLPGDVRTADACRSLVERAVAAAGRLDALVNAAGVWREGPVEACSEADFDAVVDVNLKGTFFLCSAAIPHLKVTPGTRATSARRRTAPRRAA
jgi:NAD(P)-dependent dehydrogenase (short-subunit alcohol dehydrogenase family)